MNVFPEKKKKEKIAQRSTQLSPSQYRISQTYIYSKLCAMKRAIIDTHGEPCHWVKCNENISTNFELARLAIFRASEVGRRTKFLNEIKVNSNQSPSSPIISRSKVLGNFRAKFSEFTIAFRTENEIMVRNILFMLIRKIDVNGFETANRSDISIASRMLSVDNLHFLLYIIGIASRWFRFSTLRSIPHPDDAARVFFPLFQPPSEISMSESICNDAIKSVIVKSVKPLFFFLSRLPFRTATFTRKVRITSANPKLRAIEIKKKLTTNMLYLNGSIFIQIYENIFKNIQ
ncbi:hypothetical protein PUN28_015078 [Cardiocondyla obscurior]|uniref:Uncharacterized protein n=1 Tax=Cardiocondyla obscurior TaxID=286306 RepID=A0AAW2EWX6_9HYME